MTADRTTTVDGAGSPVRGHAVWMVRKDLTAHTWTIADSTLGIIIALPPGPATPVAVCIVWNGANWSNEPSAVQYLST